MKRADEITIRGWGRGGLLDTLGKERVIASVKAKALLNHCPY